MTGVSMPGMALDGKIELRLRGVVAKPPVEQPGGIRAWGGRFCIGLKRLPVGPGAISVPPVPGVPKPLMLTDGPGAIVVPRGPVLIAEPAGPTT
jgi:hypothetical protein